MPTKDNFVTFTTQAVAQTLSASRTSVQRWIDSGMLKAFKTPGGHRRVTRRELAAFLRRQGAPIPTVLQAKVRLLVVDDDEQFLKNLKSLMKPLATDVELEPVDNSFDALLRIGAGEADAVLLDVNMRDFDCFQFLEKLKARETTAGVVVIAMSGQTDEKIQQKLLKAGAAMCLTKPITPKSLALALHELALMDSPEEFANT